MKLLTLAAVLLLATVSSSTWAQSSLDHEAHHPDKTEAPATTQPTPGQPGMGSSQGMMGGGGMMNMMGGKMPMMDMMQMMGMMRQPDAGMGGMATIDRVEGRIAFLRTELKITDAQASAWNAFADALRTNAKTLGEVRVSMMPRADVASQTLVDRLALQEKWLAARLDGTRAIKSALASLVSTFSDEQKRTADEILAPHMGMGMMTMMGAQMPSGQMGTGRMQPGQLQTPGTGK